MYKRILVPLDGSPTAEVALPYARLFAEALHLPVELLHAIDPDIIAIYSSPRYVRAEKPFEANLKEKNLGYLKKHTNLFWQPLIVSCFVEIGRPLEVIIARAESTPGTLVVMATHGVSDVQRWFLGSVAEKVLQTSTNPLLLVKGTEDNRKLETAFKTVIVPLDGSPLAEKVIPDVSDIAKQMELEIVLVRVYEMPITYFTAPDYATPMDRAMEALKTEAEKYLDEKVENLLMGGLKNVSSTALEGDSAGQIIELAKRTPHSFVAMCTHGRSGIRRLALGSVTSRVVRYSGDPVLVIRAKL